MAAINIQFSVIEIKIVKYIFKHYMDRYNPRQLARLLNVNHAHTNKLCNLLVQKKLLLKEKIGNSAYFSFNYKNNLALKFMGYLLSLEEKEFPEWLVVLLHNLQKFKPYLEIGAVFGSSIKNKEFNDIDVLLVYNKINSKEIRKIKGEIRKLQVVEKPIRYLDIAEKDIRLNKEDKVFYNIISDNLIFHNPENYVGVIKNVAY
jgi:hypothetical protein